jgi:hypothetical protein
VISDGSHSVVLARTLSLQRRTARLGRHRLNAGTRAQLNAVQLALRNIETWLTATLIPNGSPVLLAIEARLGTEARLLDAIQRAIAAGTGVPHDVAAAASQ